MSLNGLLLTALAAGLTAVANLMLRAGVTNAGGFLPFRSGLPKQILALSTDPVFVAGVFFYGLAALVWFAVISIEDLSTSYPVLVGLTFILVGIGSVVFFSESMPLQKLIGIAVILTGILVVARA